MTSKLTRERIELIANFHRAMALPPSHAEIEELARMALAAMDSEPVAWRRFQETPSDGGYWILYDYKPNCSGVEPLYRHALPAPVVPDGYVMVPVEPNGDMLAAAQDAYGETDGDIASTLRAAMLAAAPQEVTSES